MPIHSSSSASKMKRTVIKKHYLDAMGIGPIGFDYSPLETLLSDLGTSLKTPHRHEYYEIIWFTQGHGKHFIEFSAHDFGPNTLIFISPNQIHAFQNVSGIKGHVLRFGEQFFSLLPEDRPAFLKHTLFCSESSPTRIVLAESHEAFSTIMSLIDREVQTLADHQSKKMLFHLLNAFLIEAERLDTGECEATLEGRRTMSAFNQFIVLLENNFFKEHRVEQYADTLALSPKRLNEVCRSATGTSVKKIIIERIMLEAKRYLLHSELSVQETCYLLGFEDPAYFSRTFKKYTAKSPSMFRQQLAEISKDKGH